ncbi:MAG: hypothetical protein II977_01235, partial [Oscillospiraceae bacterium]|nr:hypothetical protein [Oscillospiraceae bacterium]
VTITGKTVDVSGFNFKANYVASTARKENADSATADFYGRKLVIEFPIDVEEYYIGGNHTKTNGDQSGVYQQVTAEDGTVSYEKVEYFDVPDVNIDVKDIKATPHDRYVYRTNSIDLRTRMLFTDVYIYTVEGEQQQEARAQINGINNANADITFTVKNGGDVIGYYFIEAGKDFKDGVWSAMIGDTLTPIDKITDATLKAQYEAKLTPTLTQDTTYTIEWLVDGTNDDGIEPEEDKNVSSGSTSATVYVFDPVLPFQDITAYYGEAVDINDCIISDASWYNAKLGKSSIAEGITMDGAEPKDFVLDIVWDETLIIESGDNKIVNHTSDIPFNVTKVEINKGGTKVDVTEHTDFSHVDCTEGETMPDYTAGDKAEFVIHVKTKSLEISKTVTGVDKPSEIKDSFAMTINVSTAAELKTISYKLTSTKNGETIHTAKVTDGKVTINMNHGETALIENLPLGTYTVSEEQSTKFETTTETSGTVENKYTAEVEFTNTNADLGTVDFTNEVKAGSITVKKTVNPAPGFAVPDASETFAFQLYDKLGSKVGDVFTLTDGGSLNIDNLPIGAYTVKELLTDAQKAVYTADAESKAAEVTPAGNAQVEFVNSVNNGSLEISKIVNAVSGMNPNADTFTFTVTVNGKGNGNTVNYTVNGEAKTAAFNANGVATITLKNGETAVFDKVPVGTYKVTETNIPAKYEVD